jgi:type II secretory pathway pseudopilin PulG
MRAHRARGTTLLETLVALALTALVLAALGGVVVRAHAARERTAARADGTARARTALMQIAAELEAARLPGLVLAPPAPGEEGSTLTLLEVLPRDGRPRRVRWRVERSADGGRALTRRECLAPGGCAADEEVLAGLPLVEGVTRFGVRCRDEGWEEAWAPGALPRLVEVVLGAEDAGGSRFELTTRVAIPVAGSGR